MNRNLLTLVAMSCIIATTLAITNQKHLSVSEAKSGEEETKAQEEQYGTSNYYFFERFGVSSFMVIIGSALCFFGLRFVKFFIYFIVFFLGFGFTFFIVSFFQYEGGSTQLIWTIVAACIGLTMAIALCFIPNLAEHMLGLGLGWGLGLFIVWLVSIFTTSVVWWVQLLIVIPCMIFGLLCSAKWVDMYVIYMTAFNGSIHTVLGLGILLDLIAIEKDKRDANIPAAIVGFQLIVVLFHLGSQHQVKSFKESEGKQAVRNVFAKKNKNQEEEEEEADKEETMCLK